MTWITTSEIEKSQRENCPRSLANNNQLTTLAQSLLFAWYLYSPDLNFAQQVAVRLLRPARHVQNDLLNKSTPLPHNTILFGARE
jgi:hypothetical protein